MSQTLRRRADPKRKMDWFCVFCYGDEENARIYAVHLTTANQSEIRRAYLVSVCKDAHTLFWSINLFQIINSCGHIVHHQIQNG